MAFISVETRKHHMPLLRSVTLCLVHLHTVRALLTAFFPEHLQAGEKFGEPHVSALATSRRACLPRMLRDILSCCGMRCATVHWCLCLALLITFRRRFAHLLYVPLKGQRSLLELKKVSASVILGAAAGHQLPLFLHPCCRNRQEQEFQDSLLCDERKVLLLMLYWVRTLRTGFTCSAAFGIQLKRRYNCSVPSLYHCSFAVQLGFLAMEASEPTGLEKARDMESR